MLRFTVPGEPRGKGRPRFVSTPRGGRAYTPAETVSYERMIAWCAKQAGGVIIDGPIKLTVDVFMQIPRSASRKRQIEMREGRDWPSKRPDLTNVVKCVEDGLNGILYKDDAQIVDLTVRKFWSDEPRIEVIVSALAVQERVAA